MRISTNSLVLNQAKRCKGHRCQSDMKGYLKLLLQSIKFFQGMVDKLKKLKPTPAPSPAL